MMKVSRGQPVAGRKGRARPDQVRKVMDTVAQQGAMATYKKVMNKLDTYTHRLATRCAEWSSMWEREPEELKVGQLRGGSR